MAKVAEQLQLDPDKVIETIDQLHRRISERFSGAGLAKIAVRLKAIAESAVAETRAIHRPNVVLRFGVGLLLALMAFVVVAAVSQLRFGDEASGWTKLEGIDAGLGSMVFLGATVLFLVTLESRIKRRKILVAVERLRELAHIIDMHQLTKDPERLCSTHLPTASSPQNSMTPYELGRYLDYCAEMLSLIGKVVVIYSQNTSDSVVLSSVDAIEALTTSLSRKIWQKIMLLDQIAPRDERSDSVKPLARGENGSSVDSPADE